MRFLEIVPMASIGVLMNNVVVLPIAVIATEPDTNTIEVKLRAQIVALANWALDHGCQFGDDLKIEWPDERKNNEPQKWKEPVKFK